MAHAGTEGSGWRAVFLKEEEEEGNGRRWVEENVCKGKSVAARREDERAWDLGIAGGEGKGRNEQGCMGNMKGKRKRAAN